MIVNHSNEDTIVAVATPPGQAGIGIIRISGTKARSIAKKIFRPRGDDHYLKSHHLCLGHLIDPRSEKIIDEVLLSYMKAPHSYTREDVVEINSHSGYTLLSKILEIVLNEEARLADPGEFTYRAFLKGRIDLTQAEAVVDLINSKSERGLEIASSQIRGDFRDQIEEFRQKLIDILSHIEVALDFPEEEDGIFPRQSMVERMENELLGPINKLIEIHAQHKIYMEGVKTVIVGQVNVGKSSLLNRLLNEQKAIVTAIPGTTRDVVESNINIEGLPLHLMDTAGFRKAPGEIEEIGLEFTRRKLAESDLALVVLDQSRSLSPEDIEIINQSPEGRSLLVLNKIDLPTRMDPQSLEGYNRDAPILKTSALTGQGLDDLRQAIRNLILSSEDEIQSTNLAPNLRHKESLVRIYTTLKTGLQNMKEGAPLDIIAVDLDEGLKTLGEITGQSADDEVINHIFSQFCIGK